MEYTIIPAEKEHLPDLQRLNAALCTLENECYDHTIDPRFSYTAAGEACFKKRVADGGAFLALVDGNIVGYLTASADTVEEYRVAGMIATVESVYIEQPFRGVGIGTALLERFNRWAKERGATRLRIIASVQNKSAIALYEQQGFEPYNLILEKDV